jgi:hypothetical protein
LSIFHIILKGRYYIELLKKLSYLAKPKSPIFISGVADIVANSKFCMFRKKVYIKPRHERYNWQQQSVKIESNTCGFKSRCMRFFSWSTCNPAATRRTLKLKTDRSLYIVNRLAQAMPMVAKNITFIFFDKKEYHVWTQRSG